MENRKTEAARGERAARQNAGTTNVQLHYSKPRRSRQSPTEKELQELKLMAQRAKAAGDRDGYWSFRRAYLLGQAAIYGGVQ